MFLFFFFPSESAEEMLLSPSVDLLSRNDLGNTSIGDIWAPPPLASPSSFLDAIRLFLR